MMEEIEVKFWLGELVDCWILKDVIELWFKLYGKFLIVGQYVYDKLLLMVDVLGNFFVIDLIFKMFVYY